MTTHTFATGLGAVTALVSLAMLVVPPAYGQACTPSAEPEEAARSDASLTNPAGTAVVVNGQGEVGLDATESATNHGTVISCGEVHEYKRGDGTPAQRRAHAVQVWSSDSGDVTAANSGLIETRGQGARGIYVWTDGGETATATATNSGRIVTRGEVYDGTEHFGRPYRRTADGMLAETYSQEGDATAVNERNSTIEAHGTGARGMWVWTTGTGEAKGINRGSIATHGDAFSGPDSYGSAAAGIAAQSSRGSATATNEHGATIRTHGDGAPGLYANIRGAAEGGAGARTARAENHGTIEVSGNTTFEMDDYGDEEPALVSAGVEAVVAGVDSGRATVLNTGNVTASGSAAIGLLAHDSEIGGDEYNDVAVDVEVRMTGGSVVAGRRDDSATPEEDSAPGYGIVASTNLGAARVAVSGPSTTVTAFGARVDDPNTDDFDDRGIGIVAFGGDGDSCQVPGGQCTSDTLVEISRGATITANIAVRASGTLNLYESRINGRVELDSEYGGTNDHFTIRGGSVSGDVNFHDLDDRLTITNNGYIEGDVDFGDGRDTLVFDVDGTGERITRIDGAITGIEEMYKRGSGTARVRDVMFSGSTLDLEEGGLTLAGHLDLGAEGTLTVHDESRLTIEVGDITVSEDDHGLITAGGGVIYEGLEEQESPELFMEIGADAADNRGAILARLQQAETAIDVLGENTDVLRRTDATSQPVAAETALRTLGDDGTVQNIGTLDDDGMVVVQMCPEGQVGTPPNCTTPAPEMCPEGQVGTPPNCTTPAPEMCPEGQVGTPPNCTESAPRKDDDGSSNAGAILLGGGAAAALAVYLFDLFDSEEPALVDWDESWTGSRSTTSFSGIQSGHYNEHRVRTGALEQWTRAFAGGSSTLAGGVEGTVRGIAFGWDAILPRGFDVGVSMMPEMAVSARRGPALDIGGNIEGGRYALQGGWRGDALFVDTSLSHGSYRMHSFMENPAVGGLLAGELDLTQDHAQGQAGLRLDLGRVRATPSVSLFSGSLRQGAYTARGAAVSAEVPEISQRYSGWRARLALAPSGWLDGPGALNWRPSLHLGTTHTRTSGSGSFQVRQSDHEGVLSFASRAAVKGLPRTVHGIGASVVAARSEAWNFRMGYAGMVVDGRPVHAAVARLMIRF